MGFLDDLKRQADAIKAQQTRDTSGIERNTALVEAACKNVLDYFVALAPQLNVLQRITSARYVLDRQTSFTDLQQKDFHADARRGALNQQRVFDHVVLHWQLFGTGNLVLHKNFLPDIEKLESRLRQSGAEVDSEAVRHPDTGKLQSMRYSLALKFRAQIRVKPLHEEGCVQFLLNNLDGFESVTVDFPASEVHNRRLDELARLILGEPNEFLAGGRNLRRVEA